MLPDFTGTNISLYLGEFRDSFNFRSQFLKFGVMDNYSNGLKSVLLNQHTLELLRVLPKEKCCFLAKNFENLLET